MGKLTLSDELKKYGYVFSPAKSAAVYITAFIATMLLGSLFGLDLLCRAVLCAFLIILLPFFVRNAARNAYIQRRFSDVNIYMEQFLYSFRRSRKIITALKDVRELFEKGEMRNAITEAVYHIEHTYNESDVEAHGLSKIEKRYPSPEIRMIHRFAHEAERLGGDPEKPVLLLLDYRRMWADRVYEEQAERRKNRRNVFLSVIASLTLCSFIYMFLAKRLAADFSSNPVYLCVTTAVLIIDLLIFFRADSLLSADSEDSAAADDEALIRTYERMRNYDVRKAFDRFARRAAKKTLTRAIEKEFPSWLMELSLLLCTEAPQTAIIRSYAACPAVLKLPLASFAGELKKSPDSIAPYISFLSEFELPEVRSSMKMLYSISTGTGGDAPSQIADIIRRNQSLLDRAERLKSADRMSGMYLLFLSPQLTGGVKMICDMVLLFAAAVRGGF